MSIDNNTGSFELANFMCSLITPLELTKKKILVSSSSEILPSVERFLGMFDFVLYLC